MDAAGFDRLARALSAAAPRRALLGLATGIPLGALLAGAAPRDAVAKRKRKKKRCRQLLARCTPGKAPRCCPGTVCGTSQISGSRCCRQKDRSCVFSPTRDECCPGLFCAEADGMCVPLA